MLVLNSIAQGRKVVPQKSITKLE